jgi:hypothetical protein
MHIVELILCVSAAGYRPGPTGGWLGVCPDVEYDALIQVDHDGRRGSRVRLGLLLMLASVIAMAFGIAWMLAAILD